MLVWFFHGGSDPAQEISQSGVDAILPAGGTLFSPADDTGQKPGTSVVDHKRAAAVATAGIHTGLQVPGTEHVVCDHLENTGAQTGLDFGSLRPELQLRKTPESGLNVVKLHAGTDFLLMSDKLLF